MNQHFRVFGSALLVLHLLVGVCSSASQEEAINPIDGEAQHNRAEEPHQEMTIQKRSLEEGSKEEMNILKDLLLSHVVSEIQNMREMQQEEALRQQDEPIQEKEKPSMKDKRLLAPLKGRPGDAQSIKRQIRYHQCYFNPISCFRRK